MTRQDRIKALKAAAKERVLILDGSWGVMFQKRGLTEADYRGDRFLDHPGQMKGNNDILCLTRPDIVADLHDQYYAAGADISETNTFSSTSIGQGEYAQESAVRDINLAAARIALEGRHHADSARSPDRDVARAVRAMEGGAGKLPGLALQIGEDAIAAFLVEPVEFLAEEHLVVHRRPPGSALSR
eukprot:gene64128-biopygen46868